MGLFAVQDRAIFRAYDFLCRFGADARLGAIELSCRSSKGADTASFRIGDGMAQEWIAARAGRRIDCSTGTASGQIRVISITVPRLAFGNVLKFRPAPSIIAETATDYAIAWRMYAPQSPSRAIELAHRFAEALGGKPLGFTFPVPGTAGIKLVRHLIGPDSWALVIPDAPKPEASSPILASAESIKPEPVDWLWPGVSAHRTLTLIAGKPGMGKSQIAVYAAATVSGGKAWPDGAIAERGSVILAETEDDPSSVIAPRLLAAEADMSRVKICGQIDLSTGLDSLRRVADAIPDLRLVVLSPVLTFFGSGALDEVSMRAKIKPMLQWAAGKRIAIIGITHPPKGARANDEFAGSEVFYRAARGAWSAVIDQADENPIIKAKRRLLVAAKNNIGDDTAQLPYRIEGVTLTGGISTSRVVFLPQGQADAGRPAGTEGARMWLEAFLAGGPRDAGAIKRAYLAAGIPKTTVDRAAKDLGVVRSIQAGSSAKLWSMPD